MDAVRGRLAPINIETTAVIQGQAEIVVAPGGMVPWQPVDHHGWFILQKGQCMAQHHLVKAQHALGVDDGLWHAGRAGRKQEFGNRVFGDFGIRGIDSLGRPGLAGVGINIAVILRQWIFQNQQPGILWHDGGKRLGIFCTIIDKDQAGIQ